MPIHEQQRAMVSLTYDGTQMCHAETVLPQLALRKLSGTFYADPLPLLDALPLWRAAAEAGHEIGNGCLHAAGGLDCWNDQMLDDDIAETDKLIGELFTTQTVHSFGYPWMTAFAEGITELRSIVARHHAVARSGVQGTNPLTDLEMSYFKCVPMDGTGAQEMIEIVRSGIRQGHWVVLAFDGVGSGDPAVDSCAHEALLDWLVDNRELADVLTVSQAAQRPQASNAQRPRLL